MEEKERKKREEQELKEQKKREREERKRKREEEVKQKAAERAKREEERALKKARVEEERAKKAKIRPKKAEASRKRKGTKQVSHCATSGGEPSTSISPPSTSMAPATSVSTCQLRSSRAAPTKALEDEIDTNVCCMCFIRYEDDITAGSGAEWISCSCGRWLHEDCAEDCVIDNDGKERFCSFCLEFFS